MRCGSRPYCAPLLITLSVSIVWPLCLPLVINLRPLIKSTAHKQSDFMTQCPVGLCLSPVYFFQIHLSVSIIRTPDLFTAPPVVCLLQFISFKFVLCVLYVLLCLSLYFNFVYLGLGLEIYHTKRPQKKIYACLV